jgi:hypothetical protein
MQVRSSTTLQPTFCLLLLRSPYIELYTRPVSKKGSLKPECNESERTSSEQAENPTSNGPSAGKLPHQASSKSYAAYGQLFRRCREGSFHGARALPTFVQKPLDALRSCPSGIQRHSLVARDFKPYQRVLRGIVQLICTLLTACASVSWQCTCVPNHLI